jgi:hypothetical protein
VGKQNEPMTDVKFEKFEAIERFTIEVGDRGDG